MNNYEYWLWRVYGKCQILSLIYGVDDKHYNRILKQFIVSRTKYFG